MTNRRLKVALVHNCLTPYNVPLYVRLAASSEFEFRVFTTHVVKYEGNGRLKFVHTSPHPGWFRRLGDRVGVAVPDFTLLREVKHYQPDAILTDGLSSVGTSLWLFATIWKHRAHCFWWSFGAIPGRPMSLRSTIGDMLQKFCVRRCAGIIAYGTHAIDYYRRLGVPIERITVGYNTIDEAQIQQDVIRLAPQVPALRASLRLDDFPVAVFCGTMKPGKKVDLLLSAFAKCRAMRPQANPHLVLIGDGPDLPAMQAVADRLGVAPHVRFVGRQDADISVYFLLGQFVVLPGLGGLAINHAFAHGLPVICGPADGCELDLVKTGETGVLLSVVTEQNLAESMAELFGHPDDCARMGREARQLVLQKISLENYARRVEGAVVASFNRTGE